MANKDLEEIQDELKKAEDRLKEILEEHGAGAHQDEDEILPAETSEEEEEDNTGTSEENAANT